jgi:hypothetical protein
MPIGKPAPWEFLHAECRDSGTTGRTAVAAARGEGRVDGRRIQSG